MESTECVNRMAPPFPRSVSELPKGSSRIDGSLALEYLGRVLVCTPMIGLLFTSLWSVGVALIAVVVPLTWLGRDGKVPAWMLAKPETPRQ